MDEAQQQHDQTAGDAIQAPHHGDGRELARLMEEGEQLRERSRELVRHGHELTEHSKRLRDQMREVWTAGAYQQALASDDPTIQPDPEA
jgi:Na+/phosphate symporter